jgi:hypothetical protein
MEFWEWGEENTVDGPGFFAISLCPLMLQYGWQELQINHHAF